MVDCPIGKCSTALIFENGLQLSAPSARYVLDNLSAMGISWTCVLDHNVIL